MASYPREVQIAWDVVDQFMRDYAQEPNRWIYEADLQVELGRRLATVFQLLGIDMLEEWRFQGDQWHAIKVPAVGNQPSVWMPEITGGKRFRPDLVIWKRLNEEQAKKSTMWPMLWACEIKLGAKGAHTKDIEKLELLRKHRLLEFGCALRVHTSTSYNEVEWEWTKSGESQHIWVAEVHAPQMVSKAML